MVNDSIGSDMKHLWQSQPTEPPNFSPEQLRRKMRSFERRIFWRNVREYAAGALVLAGFGFYEWKLTALLLRIGSGLTIAGTIYVMFQLHRRASIRPAPADWGLGTCIDLHRLALERQRDALRTVWSWYLLPFIPGFAVFSIGANMSRWTAHPGNLGHLILSFGIPAGGVAAIFWAIWKLNQSAAEKLQAQIDELDELGGGLS
jgi:hypothetical protein